MGYPPRKPHVSPSQLDMYFRCGEQYRRRYINREVIPPGIALVKGSAVHKAAEVNFAQKIETREDLPLEQLQGAAEEHIDVMIAKDGLFLPPEQASIGMQKVLGDAKDRTQGMVRALRMEIAPRIQPAMTEKFIRIPLPKHTHDLLGRLDLATEDRRVKDLKTSSKRKYQDEVDRSDQLTFYHMAYEYETGAPPAGIDLEVIVETKVPSVQSLTSQRTMDDRKVLLHRINAMIAGVQAGTFLPAAPGSWICSPRFCGFYGSCGFINSERKAAAEANAALL